MQFRTPIATIVGRRRQFRSHVAYRGHGSFFCGSAITCMTSCRLRPWRVILGWIRDVAFHGFGTLSFRINATIVFACALKNRRSRRLGRLVRGSGSTVAVTFITCVRSSRRHGTITTAAITCTKASKPVKRKVFNAKSDEVCRVY